MSRSRSLLELPKIKNDYLDINIFLQNLWKCLVIRADVLDLLIVRIGLI